MEKELKKNWGREEKVLEKSLNRTRTGLGRAGHKCILIDKPYGKLLNKLDIPFLNQRDDRGMKTPAIVCFFYNY